jgi:NCS1 family nucleobase:cation symporter-1
MSDEEIYQALGSAQASEDGLARAMAIVEEQANLREHDNQLFAEWVARMQASEAPQARIALENIERAKQGLEPLPITTDSSEPLDVQTAGPSVAPVDDIVAALNAAHIETVEHQIEPEQNQADEEVPVSIFASLREESIEEAPQEPAVVEPVAEVFHDQVVEIPVVLHAAANEPSEEEFDQLLAESASEATTSITVAGAKPAVTFEHDENFAVSADEDALVEELSRQKTSGSGWWQNAAFWVIAAGVLAPVLGSYVAAAAGLSFGTALAGFSIGLAINLGLIVVAHFVRQRTSEPSVVATRATFGVFGAVVPGVVSLLISIAGLATATIGLVWSFNGVFATTFNLADSALGGFSWASLVAGGAVFVVGIGASLVAKVLDWINGIVAGLLVVAFAVLGLLTRSLISFDSIDFSIDSQKALLFALGTTFIGVFFFGKAPKVSATVFGKGSTVARWVAIVGGAVILPVAVFAHFALVFEQNKPDNGFALVKVAQLLPSSGLATAVIWVVLISAITLLANLTLGVTKSLRGLAVNQERAWFGVVVSAAVGALVLFWPNWSLWLSVLITIIPLGAVSVGFAVGDTIIRRGAYHEASLLRSYGFYGAFNVVGIIGYVLISAATLSISEPNDLAPWLGFSSWSTPFAGAIGFGAAALWVFATSIHRVNVQQKEVAEVELRKASLSSFSGFSE